jgi:hypothetical protein
MMGKRKRRFCIEKLEKRIAHADLLAASGSMGGPNAAPEQNAHFSGRSAPLVRWLSTEERSAHR